MHVPEVSFLNRWGGYLVHVDVVEAVLVVVGEDVGTVGVHDDLGTVEDFGLLVELADLFVDGGEDGGLEGGGGGFANVPHVGVEVVSGYDEVLVLGEVHVGHD